jgi:hypothetical protein
MAEHAPANTITCLHNDHIRVTRDEHVGTSQPGKAAADDHDLMRLVMHR